MSHITHHSHTSQCLLYINSVHCLYNITALDQLLLSSQVVHSTQQVSWSSSSPMYIGIASTHNSIFPCHSCKIKATCGLGCTYYVPLEPPSRGDQGGMTAWEGTCLSLQEHQDFLQISAAIGAARTKTEQDQIAKESGIKHLPALTMY